MMHTLPVKALTTQCPLLQTGLCHGWERITAEEKQEDLLYASHG
jgi:hypothetical protein